MSFPKQALSVFMTIFSVLGILSQATADTLCPQVFLGTQVDPATQRTLYIYGGTKCPGNFGGTATDTKTHTLGGNCSQCTDPITLPGYYPEKTTLRLFSSAETPTAPGYHSPRIHHAGSFPPGRLAPIYPAKDIHVVKDFEVVVKRIDGSKHFFRIMGLQHREPNSPTYFMGFEIAEDDPDRDPSTETVRGRLQDPASTGLYHVITYKGNSYSVASATEW